MRRARGASLVEVMISMALVLVGMGALARVLVTSVTGSATAARLAQAERRASSVIEAMRLAPPSTMACLAGKPSAEWSACGASFALASGDPRFVLDASSRVVAGGQSGTLYDVTVVVAFGDDRRRAVALRSAVWP